MPATLVLQSHRDPLPFAWLRPCLDSVAAWARCHGFDYRFIGDELFDGLDADLRARTAAQPVIASDLARLEHLQRALDEGYDCAVWCDADFLVFDAAGLLLPSDAYALGREVWVQHDARDRLRAYVKVHNAMLMFRRDNPFLGFYRDTAQRLVRGNHGSMAPQYIGPKWLTALHNIAACPVIENAGMLSPLVMRDLLAGGGAALDLFRHKSAARPAGANLSSSVAAREGLDEGAMQDLVRRLLERGI